MKNYKSENRKLLKLFISEADRWKGKPLYLAIMDLCREKEISGVTVLRGIAGYGLHKTVHTDKILALSGELPLVVEIIAREEQVGMLIPLFDDMLDGGLVTLDDIEVVSSDK